MRLFFLILLLFAPQKEDLSKPPSMEIAAPPAQVRALIVKHYASAGWRIDQETESAITFSRRAGMKSRMAYGGEPRAVDSITLIPSDQQTIVIVNLSVEVERFNGRIERYNWNADKAARKEAVAFLSKLKATAEAHASL